MKNYFTFTEDLIQTLTSFADDDDCKARALAVDMFPEFMALFETGNQNATAYTIEHDADIKDCVVMQNSRLCEGAYLRNVIIDKDVVVGPGARIVGTPDMPAVVRKGSVIVA